MLYGAFLKDLWGSAPADFCFDAWTLETRFSEHESSQQGNQSRSGVVWRLSDRSARALTFRAVTTAK